jgi:hypothetical protein
VVTRECLWEDLATQGFAPFHAVFCVGNSLAHARGRDARRGALAAMAEVLAPGGVLVVTARNFELSVATSGGSAGGVSPRPRAACSAG